MSNTATSDSKDNDDGKINDIDDNDDGKDKNKIRGGGDVGDESGGNTHLYCWILFLRVILFLKKWNEKSHDTY